MGHIKIETVQKKTKYTGSAEHNMCALTLVISLASYLSCCPAYALDSPFDFDSGRWMSSDNYDDNAVRHPPPAEQEKPVIVAPVVSENQPSSTTSAPPPALTPPVATFLTPTMPGLNKGFDLRVSSTEETAKKNNPVITADAPPDIRLPDKDWESPSIKKHASKEQDDENQQNTPINFRMTFLPTKNIIPVPSNEHESAQKLGHSLQRKKAAEASRNASTKTPEVAAACAALDTYKKQQLDAIQSDRQTLIALQDAIHSLGLTKQLGFMTEQNAALNQPVNQSFAPNAQ